MNQAWIDVPVSALAALAERERVGQLHVTLRPQALWLSDEDRATADKQIDEALAGTGLVDARGRTAVDFLDWLPLLTTPSLEYYGWMTSGEETLGVLAATRGLQGVVAVCAGDWVRIRSADRQRLAEALVEQLPVVGAGGGNPRSVRVAQLVAAGRSRSDEHPLDPVLADIVSLVQRPVSGSGELYAGRRDEVGRYSRLEQPLHYADTDWGRYLNYTTGSGDDAEIHLGPATPAALAATLKDLAAALPAP
jgi:hypothetical protein